MLHFTAHINYGRGIIIEGFSMHLNNKQDIYLFLKMKVNRNKCLYCGGCVGICPVNALELEEVTLKVDEGKCTKCGLCVKFCPVAAIRRDEE
jgi:ferredoxin